MDLVSQLTAGAENAKRLASLADKAARMPPAEESMKLREDIMEFVAAQAICATVQSLYKAMPDKTKDHLDYNIRKLIEAGRLYRSARGCIALPAKKGEQECP